MPQVQLSPEDVQAILANRENLGAFTKERALADQLYSAIPAQTRQQMVEQVDPPQLDRNFAYARAARGIGDGPQDAEAFAKSYLPLKFPGLAKPTDSLPEMTRLIFGTPLDVTATLNNIAGLEKTVASKDDPLDLYRAMSQEQQAQEAMNWAGQQKPQASETDVVQRATNAPRDISMPADVVGKSAQDTIQTANEDDARQQYEAHLRSTSPKYSVIDAERALPKSVRAQVQIAVATKNVEHLAEIFSAAPEQKDKDAIRTLATAYTGFWDGSFAGAIGKALSNTGGVMLDRARSLAEKSAQTPFGGEGLYSTLRSAFGDKLSEVIDETTGEVKDAGAVRSALVKAGVIKLSGLSTMFGPAGVGSDATLAGRLSEETLKNFPAEFKAGKKAFEDARAAFVARESLRQQPRSYGWLGDAFIGAVGFAPELAASAVAGAVAGPTGTAAYWAAMASDHYDRLVYEKGLSTDQAALVTLPAAVAYGLLANVALDKFLPLTNRSRAEFLKIYEANIAKGYGAVAGKVLMSAGKNTVEGTLVMEAFQTVDNAIRVAAKEAGLSDVVAEQVRNLGHTAATALIFSGFKAVPNTVAAVIAGKDMADKARAERVRIKEGDAAKVEQFKNKRLETIGGTDWEPSDKVVTDPVEAPVPAAEPRPQQMEMDLGAVDGEFQRIKAEQDRKAAETKASLPDDLPAGIKAQEGQTAERDAKLTLLQQLTAKFPQLGEKLRIENTPPRPGVEGMSKTGEGFGTIFADSMRGAEEALQKGLHEIQHVLNDKALPELFNLLHTVADKVSREDVLQRIVELGGDRAVYEKLDGLSLVDEWSARVVEKLIDGKTLDLAERKIWDTVKAWAYDQLGLSTNTDIAEREVAKFVRDIMGRELRGETPPAPGEAVQGELKLSARPGDWRDALREEYDKRIAKGMSERKAMRAAADEVETFHPSAPMLFDEKPGVGIDAAKLAKQLAEADFAKGHWYKREQDSTYFTPDPRYSLFGGTGATWHDDGIIDVQMVSGSELYRLAKADPGKILGMMGEDAGLKWLAEVNRFRFSERNLKPEVLQELAGRKPATPEDVRDYARVLRENNEITDAEYQDALRRADTADPKELDALRADLADQVRDFARRDERYSARSGNAWEEAKGIPLVKDPQGRLLAPNGQPSNLTEPQWQMVRTPTFKRWFGDWELTAKASAVRALPVIPAAEGPVSSAEAEAAYRKQRTATTPEGRNVVLVNETFGKLTRHKNGEQLQRVVPIFQKLLGQSVHAWSEDPRNPETHRNINQYHNYVAKTALDGREYFVRFTIQDVNKPDGNEMHNAALSDVEMVEAAVGLVHSRSIDRAKAPNSGLDKPLLGWLQKVNSVKTSKAVDANGEPLVTYHGTQADVTTFDPAKKGDATAARSAKLAFFFTDSPRVADGYSRLEAGRTAGPIEREANRLYDIAERFRERRQWPEYQKAKAEYEAKWAEFMATVAGKGEYEGANMMPLYLAVKNPKVVDAKGAGYGEGVPLAPIIEQAKAEGHDGVVFQNLRDAATKDTDVPSTVYAVFEPTQIKSVTGNTGAFDPANPDIRYSARPVDEAELRKIAGNEKVDGREVINRDDIPNRGSISASLGNYKILPGLREVPMDAFTLTGKHYSADGQRRIDRLAEEIRNSGQITPLIVVQDNQGYYILEGGTRADALAKLGAKSFPAMVVKDLDSLGTQFSARPAEDPAAVQREAAVELAYRMTLGEKFDIRSARQLLEQHHPGATATTALDQAKELLRTVDQEGKSPRDFMRALREKQVDLAAREAAVMEFRRFQNDATGERRKAVQAESLKIRTQAEELRRGMAGENMLEDGDTIPPLTKTLRGLYKLGRAHGRQDTMGMAAEQVIDARERSLKTTRREARIGQLEQDLSRIELGLARVGDKDGGEIVARNVLKEIFGEADAEKLLKASREGKSVLAERALQVLRDTYRDNIKAEAVTDLVKMLVNKGNRFENLTPNAQKAFREKLAGYSGLLNLADGIPTAQGQLKLAEMMQRAGTGSLADVEKAQQAIDGYTKGLSQMFKGESYEQVVELRDALNEVFQLSRAEKDANTADRKAQTAADRLTLTGEAEKVKAPEFTSRDAKGQRAVSKNATLSGLIRRVFGGRETEGHKILAEDPTKAEDAKWLLVGKTHDAFTKKMAALGISETKLAEWRNDFRDVKVGKFTVNASTREMMEWFLIIQDPTTLQELAKSKFNSKDGKGTTDGVEFGDGIYAHDAIAEAVAKNVPKEAIALAEFMFDSIHDKAWVDRLAAVQIAEHMVSDYNNPYYWPRSRDVTGSPTRGFDEAMLDAGGKPKGIGTQSIAKRRYTSKRPVLYNDAIDTYFAHVEEVANRVHLYLPLKRAFQALNSAELNTAITHRWGADVPNDVREVYRRMWGVDDPSGKWARTARAIQKAASIAYLWGSPSSQLNARLQGGMMIEAQLLADYGPRVAAAFAAKSFAAVPTTKGFLLDAERKAAFEYLRENDGYFHRRWGRYGNEIFASVYRPGIEDLRDPAVAAKNKAVWDAVQKGKSAWSKVVQFGMDPLMYADMKNAVNEFLILQDHGFSKTESLEITKRHFRDSQPASSAADETANYRKIRDAWLVVPFMAGPSQAASLLHGAVVDRINAATPAEKARQTRRVAAIATGVLLAAAMGAAISRGAYSAATGKPFIPTEDDEKDQKARLGVATRIVGEILDASTRPGVGRVVQTLGDSIANGRWAGLTVLDRPIADAVHSIYGMVSAHQNDEEIPAKDWVKLAGALAVFIGGPYTTPKRIIETLMPEE